MIRRSLIHIQIVLKHASIHKIKGLVKNDRKIVTQSSELVQWDVYNYIIMKMPTG